MSLARGEMTARVSERDGRLVIATADVEVPRPSCRLATSATSLRTTEHWTLLLIDPLAHAGEDEAHGGHLTAPMSGTVVAVMVKAGDNVRRARR